jgi:hypothetical protein
MLAVVELDYRAGLLPHCTSERSLLNGFAEVAFPLVSDPRRLVENSSVPFQCEAV